MNEPILEQGMIELIGEMEIFSKIGEIWRNFGETPRIYCNFDHFQWILSILRVWAPAISPHLKIFLLHVLV